MGPVQFKHHRSCPAQPDTTRGRIRLHPNHKPCAVTAVWNTLGWQTRNAYLRADLIPPVAHEGQPVSKRRAFCPKSPFMMRISARERLVHLVEERAGWPADIGTLQYQRGA